MPEAITFAIFAFVALAGAVVISSFVALTLTPMLCSRILRVQPHHGRLYEALEDHDDIQNVFSDFELSEPYAVN